MNKKQIQQRFFRAVEENDVAAARKMIAAGADVNLPDDGKPALFFAASWEYMRMLKLLLKSGADVHARDKYGEDILSYIMAGSSITVLRTLIAAGADVNARCNEEGEISYPVSRAFLGGKEHLQLMLESGANPNVVESDKGMTPLEWVRLDAWVIPDESLLECAELLKQYGALEDLELDIDNWGIAPLEYEYLDAVRRNNLRGVRRALAKGADVNALDGQGTSAMVQAAVHQNFAMCKLMVEHGLKHCHIVKGVGECICGNREPLKLFLYLFSLLGKGERKRLSPSLVEYAARHGFYNIINLLLDAGVKPRNALSCAALYGNEKVLRLLLRRGANPNGRMCERPLYNAVCSSEPSISCAKILLKAGAKPSLLRDYERERLEEVMNAAKP